MANIILRLSTGTLSSQANTNPVRSLGGKMSLDAGAIINDSNTTMNNLFDDVTKAQNYQGSTEYRCVYIHNDTADTSQTVSAMKIYVEAGSKATVEIALGAKNTDAPVITGESDPSSVLTGVSFSAPSSTFKLNITTGSEVFNAGDKIPLWIKRTVSNIIGSGVIQDTIGIVIEGIE